MNQFSFSQTSKLTLEDKIYNAIDVFVADPNKQSLDSLDENSKLFFPKSKPEYLALVILYCNKAYYENQFNLSEKAIMSYEKAWQVFQSKNLNNYDITEYCLKPLGNLYTIIGDYDNAENTIKQYYFIANSENNQDQRIAAILNLSNVYLSSSKSELAINLLDKTLQTEKLNRIQKGNLLNNLGTNYLIIKSYKKAKKAIENSIKLLESQATETENLSNSYRNLSQIYSLEKNYNLANFYLNQAVNDINNQKNIDVRTKTKLLYEQALLNFNQGNSNASKKIITAIFHQLVPTFDGKKQILPVQKTLFADTILLDALDLQAEIFLKKKNIKLALQSYDLCFYIEDLFQEMLVYENSKIISQIRNRNRIEKCIEIYYNLYQKNKNELYLEKAFQLSEISKSFVLKDFVKQNKTNSKNIKNIQIKLQDLNNIILKEQQKQDLADIDKINLAIKKQNELMLLLKNNKSKTDDFIDQNINLETLFKKLNSNNAAMVSYFSGNKSNYCFILQKNNIELFKLDNANDAKSIIREFLSYFKDSDTILNDVSGYNNVGNLTYQYLKIPKKSSAENLVIISDGILNFLPFEALITTKTATTNFAKMHYLVNDYKISYNNSVAFYMKENQKNNKNKDNVLGVFPIFEKTNLELTFSKNELQNLKTNFKGTFLEKKDATFNNFKKNASNFSILHLSTHASAGNVDEPASIRFYDQEILYSELYYLGINPDLVVLSACETGLGKLYKAEGSMSVARGFQFAGAQNLLFSLWKVNDYTTSVFMSYFYDNLKKGISYSDANYKAKLDFLNDKSISNTKKSPYFWAPMVYYGNIESTTSYLNYILFSSIIVLVLIGVFVWLRRKKTA